MSFQLTVDRTNVEVILHKDSSVNCTREEYDQYLESFGAKAGPNEDFLRVVDRKATTRFVLRRNLPFAQKQTIRSKNIKLRKDDVELDVNYSTDMVRAALIDVHNPDDVPDTKAIRFKRDKDGLASSELIGALDDAGVLNDLVTAYTNATSPKDDAAKNS